MGCQDSAIDVDNTIPGNEDDTSSETYYMAMRIYNAAIVDGGTRSRAEDDENSYFDSTGDSYGDSNNKFNMGLADESEIYTGTTDFGSPHFLLVFASGDDGTLDYIFDLKDWDYEKNGEEVDNKDNTTSSGYKSYKTLYTSAQKTDVPADFNNRKMLAVINASKKLRQDITAALYKKKYSEILDGIKISRPAEPSTNAEENIAATETDVAENFDYLYLIQNNKRYFTMTSSMVIPISGGSTSNNTFVTPIGKYGPAVIKRDYTWYPSKSLAIQYPIYSFFLERLQSKFTLTFQGKNNVKHYFASAAEAASNGYKKDIHIVFESGKDFAPSSDWQTIKYMKEYERTSYSTLALDEIESVQLGYEVQTTDEWKINITGWGINAVEKEEYAFKKLNEGSDYYTGWNNKDYSYYRNFWAEGVHYSNTVYPDQYRSVFSVKKYDNNGVEVSKDKPGIWKIIESTDASDFSSFVNKGDEATLRYFNLNELQTSFSRQSHQYGPEHTFSMENTFSKYETPDKAFADQAHIRAGSHIIVAAQLLIKGLDTDDVYKAEHFNSEGGAIDIRNNKAENKLLMNGIFWSKQAYRGYVCEYLGYWMQEMEDVFGPNNGIFYFKSNDLSNPTPVTSTYLDVEPLKAKGGDNWVHVIPDLNAVQTVIGEKYIPEDHPYYDDRDPESNRIVCYSFNPEAEEEDDMYRPISRYMFEILALLHPEYFAQRFNTGRMYYVIPITHNTKPDPSSKLALGNFGNVRNHWYNFTVTNFKGIGTPVDSFSQEIIPNNERSYESLGITLAILPWHTVSEPVDITDQRPQLKPDVIDIDLLLKADDWIYSGSEASGF